MTTCINVNINEIIVITKGRHILNCDEIESEGKRIEINIGDISNCGDVIV